MSSKNSRFDFNSIRFRIWTYFVLLGIAIILIIWALQTLLINHGYEAMKITEVQNVADFIYNAYTNDDESLNENLEKMSIGNDCYVMMEYDGTLLLFTPEEDSVAPVFKYRDLVPRLKELLSESDPETDSVSFQFSNHFDEFNTLAYCRYLENSEKHQILLYIFSPLYPLDSTIGILQDMLTIAMIITLFMALGLALLISRRLARPIKSITNSARQMGTGDYSVHFEGNSYTEINNLADTLNVTAYELGQADIRQKDLVANVSHDLKTPLTMIRSYAEMIRDLSGDIPEKRNNHLQVIMDESDKMSRLITDMTTISSMNMHKLELNKGYFDLSEMTASILASYEIYQEQQGYSFRFTVPKDKVCMVFADGDRIRQVIVNLVENAIKYCGEDKVIMVNIRKADKKYRLEVSDHGPGIKPEELPHVWDRYYRTSTNYARETKGTGLGLSIVKEILTLHLAPFGVNSKVGKGTTFWFELEIAKPQKK